MALSFDRIFRNATVVNHDGAGARDIGVRDGKIAALGDLSQASAGEVIDCTGLTILPGVIDTQVHFREPGPTHKEDLESGSLAAVMGGVTSVFEMPNTTPLTTTEAALADKVRRGTHRMHCDFAFWFGGTHQNAADVAELERLPGTPGIKVFMGSSTGSLLVEDDDGVAAILRHTKRRAAFHSEDEYRLNARKSERIAGDPRSHPVWRDEQAALLCTQRLITIARSVNAKIHVLHISTGDEIPLLAANKDIVSAEVTPHHLTLFAPDCYDRLGTKAQMNPPVRDISHQQRLWAGLEAGVLDIFGSDHAPHTLQEKAKSYPDSPSGMTGVQTLVPLMLDHVNKGRLSLQRFVDMTSAGPQRLFGIAGKGRLAVGYDADLTVVDMKKTVTITDDWIASKAGWTPYHGVAVTGWPVGTIVRGRKVMWEGALVEKAQGEVVRFA